MRLPFALLALAAAAAAQSGSATMCWSRPPVGRAVAVLRSPAADARRHSGRLQVAATCAARLPASLLASSGAALTAVQPAQVRVLSPRGARITAVQPAPARHVELLIDGDGALARGGLWQTSRMLAQALLAAAPPTTPVGLTAFADTPQVLAPFHAPASGYQAALAKAYAGYHPRGGTALYDALALSVAASAFRPGDAIVAIGGGFDDASNITATAAARALQAGRIRLFLLPLGAPAMGEVGALVRDSGGELLDGARGNRAKTARRVWQALQGQVRLNLQLAPGSAGRLRLAPARTLHDVRILAPHPLLACR